MDDSNRFDISIVIDTAKRVLTEPVAFYQSMATAGGYANPAIFILVMSVAAGLVGSLWALFGFGPAAAAVSGGFAIFLMPIFMLIGSFIGALVLFVIWKLMGSTHNYEVAYRCLAFTTAILPVVAIANLIPYLGQIIQVVWGLWLIVIASEQVHKISRQTAFIVFGILGALSLLTNISAEHQARKFQKYAENLQQEIDTVSGNAEDMTAPQLGKAASDFLAGLKEGSTGEKLTEQERAELEQAGEAFGQFIEGMQQTAKELEDQEIENPEQAGAAMGTFLRNLEKAANSMQQQAGPAGQVLAQAPDLGSLDMANLSALGTISKPSDQHAIQFAVNDDERFAPLSRPINVYRDSAGIRYQLWLENAYLSEFTSLGPGQLSAAVAAATAAMAESGGTAGDSASLDRYGKTAQVQNIAVRNAGIYIYDRHGSVVGGDQCQHSVLQVPAFTAESSAASEQEFWLWCPLAQRSAIEP